MFLEEVDHALKGVAMLRKWDDRKLVRREV